MRLFPALHALHSPFPLPPPPPPAAQVIKSQLTDTIVSHGSYLQECSVNHAIIGLRSRINKDVTIQVGGGAGLLKGEEGTPPAQNAGAGLCVWTNAQPTSCRIVPLHCAPTHCNALPLADGAPHRRHHASPPSTPHPRRTP